uniref:eIF-4F 25 kDa subunit n=1 Tax=Nelumbo nucifera TaxID=4432 RepID=A0A823A1U7_NELNU|nr:TPA_asm: hypothetical protein HUJ06_018055 [Nelumbo nucifera]
MIGEQFEHGEEICGAVINVRGKQEKISLWTKNASNETAQVTTLIQPKANELLFSFSASSYTYLVHIVGFFSIYNLIFFFFVLVDKTLFSKIIWTPSW